jgi:Tfp pilus assembly protein PilE
MFPGWTSRFGGARRGLTLLDLLAAVAIMVIMMALAAPVFLPMVTNAKQSDCRANLQAIANAEEQYRRKNTTHAYTTTLSDLSQQGAGVPKCPDGGTYTITISNGTATAQNGQTVPSGGLVISCSAAGHGKYAPGIDNQ